MSAKLADTGERMIPEHHKGKSMYGAHIARYKAALPFVSKKTVLDIACGSGYGSKMLASNANKVIGVDNSQEAINYAKEKYNSKKIDYLLGSAESIPLEDNTVDVVVSYETIEHIQKYQKFMEEIKRVLKQDGTLIISTPNKEVYGEGNRYHLHEFGFSEHKRIIEKFFKYHQDYFQTVSLYSSILDEKMQSTEWESPILTINTLPLPPNKSMYLISICSDEILTQKIEPIGATGQLYNVRENQKAEVGRRVEVEKMASEIENLHHLSEEMGIKNSELKTELAMIRSSRTWRLRSKIVKVFRRR